VQVWVCLCAVKVFGELGGFVFICSNLPHPR
jgi:hypothetical protein